MHHQDQVETRKFLSPIFPHFWKNVPAHFLNGEIIFSPFNFLLWYLIANLSWYIGKYTSKICLGNRKQQRCFLLLLVFHTTLAPGRKSAAWRQQYAKNIIEIYMRYKMEWFEGLYGGRRPKGKINVILSNTTWAWAMEALKPGKREEI